MPYSTDPPPPGVKVATEHLRAFATEMGGSADRLDSLGTETLRFDAGGLHELLPLTGIPLVATLFVGRLNTIVDTWAETKGILAGVVREDGGKLHDVAKAYDDADHAAAPGPGASPPPGRGLPHPAPPAADPYAPPSTTPPAGS